MKIFQLKTFEDIDKIKVGTKIRILDETSDSGRGFFSTCMEKKGGIYVFAGTPGCDHLPEERELNLDPMKNLVKIMLERGDGYVRSRSWFFDGSCQGAVERVEKTNPEFKSYSKATKDIVDFLRQQDRTWFYLGWMKD